MEKSKKKAVEKELFQTGDGTRLTVAHFHPSGSERGIILIPPLIGGSFILFGRQFAHLVRQGYRVVSFNYRGHGDSEGLFTLRASFDDALQLARRLKERNPLTPLFGVGTCSGSMPLFHILTRAPGLLSGIVFINAIYHLQQTATPFEAMGLYLKSRGLCPPRSIGDLTAVVLDRVFPEIAKSSEHFGILRYDRVDFRRVALEYLFKLGPQDFAAELTPALCLYGTRDEMLGLTSTSQEREYRREFERRFTDVSFVAFEADHFMEHLTGELSEHVYGFVERRGAIRTLWS